MNLHANAALSLESTSAVVPASVKERWTLATPAAEAAHLVPERYGPEIDPDSEPETARPLPNENPPE
jgi:hypothetical protein